MPTARRGRGHVLRERWHSVARAATASGAGDAQTSCGTVTKGPPRVLRCPGPRSPPERSEAFLTLRSALKTGRALTSPLVPGSPDLLVLEFSRWSAPSGGGCRLSGPWPLK